MELHIDEKPPCMDSDTMPPKQVGIQWIRVVAPNATVHPELYLEARSVHYNNRTSYLRPRISYCLPIVINYPTVSIDILVIWILVKKAHLLQQ